MTGILPENWFVKHATLNALISWALTGVLAVAVGAGLVNGQFNTVVIAGAAATVAVLPALIAGSWTQTVPWPLLLAVTFPILFGASGSFFGFVMVGVGVAALALLVAVTLQETTTVLMTPNFAIGFVMICTLGTAGLWAVVSAALAEYLGSGFVETNEQLMHIFSAALVASIVSGLIFRWYFGQQLKRDLSSDSTEEPRVP